LVDLRYHPGKYNLQQLAEGFKVEVGVMPRWDPQNECNIPCKHELIYDLCNPCQANQITPLEAMYKFWEKNDPYFDWFKEAEENKAVESTECSQNHPASWRNKLLGLAKQTWKKITNK
jgi:hypothetical protein